MAQTTTSAPQQGVAMPAVDLRQMVGALVASEGVRTPSDLVVSQRGAGANMSVDVAPGSCVISDDHASGGGVYSYTLGSTFNATIGTANATNPRVDRVVVTVLDNALGDASNSAAVSVVAGTPTSGATLTNLSGAAAVPSSSLLLANVLVGTSATSITTANISNKASIVLPVGGSLIKVYDSVEAGVSLPSASITTASLPQTYKHLVVEICFRSTSSTSPTRAILRCNGDTANYSSGAATMAVGTGWLDTSPVKTDGIYFGYGQHLATSTAGQFSALRAIIPNYALAVPHTIEASGLDANGPCVGGGTYTPGTAAAVTTLTLTGSTGTLDTQSRLTVYAEN